MRKRFALGLGLLLLSGCSKPALDASSVPFDPPPDTVADDPALAPGVLLVTAVDAQDQPIGGAPITLEIQRDLATSSAEKLERTTDARGSVRFDDLGFGPHVSYGVHTHRGEGNYGLSPFSLSNRSGKQVTLHAYEATDALDHVLVGVQGTIALSVDATRVHVDCLFDVVNLEPIAWVPKNASFALPAGATGFWSEQGGDDPRVAPSARDRLVLRGTFGPGRHALHYRFDFPRAAASRELRLEVPPRLGAVRVVIEGSDALEVQGFPEPTHRTSDEGKPQLVTEATSPEGAFAAIVLRAAK